MQIRFRFFCDAARVPIVRLARDRIDDGANETERRLRIEDIDPCRRRIGDDEHVARVDGAPAANTRAVEAEAIGEYLLVVFGEGGGEMLPGTRQIGEFKIHELHVVVLDHFADVGGGFVFGHGSG